MGHTKDSIHINAPVDKVVDFGADPQKWATFMTGMSGPDKTIGDGGVGTQWEITMRTAGLRMQMTVRLVENRREPDGGAHSRFEFDGGWQTWDQEPEDGGTLVTMEEEYTVPGSVLGKVADRLVFEKMNARDMHHSLENLKLLVEETAA
jgi:coenzyme Q-binding protein COQ10